MSKGFFTLAQGSEYIRNAYALALSLKYSQYEVTELTIGVDSIDSVPEQYKWAFDNIIEIPWGDHSAGDIWKRKNEWKAIYMSPYDETIKLDADMLFTNDISEWWEILQQSEIVFTTEVKTYRGLPAIDNVYRKTFIDNSLPNIYTAFFYFKKTDVVFELFKLVELITNNWQLYYENFLEANSRPTFMSADVVFALACKLLEIDRLNNNHHFDIPTFVHMKSQIQGWDNVTNENWPEYVPTYFTPDCDFKVGNYLQILPFHYHQKHFLTDEIIGYLERQVK